MKMKFCCCSVTKLCPNLCDPMNCNKPGFPVLHYLPELAELHSNSRTLMPSLMPFNHLILCCLLLLLPSVFPSIRVFPMSWLFASGGQTTGASASASLLPVSIQGWSPLGLTGLISLLSKGLSSIFSSTTVQKHQFFSAQPSFWSNSHIRPYMTTGKTIVLVIQTFVGKVMSLSLSLFFFSMLFDIAFLTKSKHLLISWTQSPSTVILEPKKIKAATVFSFPHLFAMKWYYKQVNVYLL